MSGAVKGDLVSPWTVHAINRTHRLAEGCYDQSDMTQTLREVKVRQMKVRQMLLAERELLACIEKLLRFYIDALEGAADKKENDEIASLLRILDTNDPSTQEQ